MCLLPIVFCTNLDENTGCKILCPKAINTCVMVLNVVVQFLQVPVMHSFPASQSVVVMDNCAIHGKDDIKNVVSAFGGISLFLPPYSPEFNPIEKIFSRVKQWLMRRRAYVSNPLVPAERALREAFASITPATCEAYIRGWPMYDV